MATVDSDAQADRFEVAGRAVCAALSLRGEAALRTPERFAQVLREFSGTAPKPEATVFPCALPQTIEVRDIEAWALCEHHLLPFKLRVAVRVRTDGFKLGLSKYARLAQWQAARPTTQEDFTAQLCALLQLEARTAHVAVEVEGEHLCCRMRGARTSCVMRTQAQSGVFA